MGVYPTGVVNKDGDIDQLIRYFPEDPQNIKQLYRRAQRIDCEYWEQNQHEEFQFWNGHANQEASGAQGPRRSCTDGQRESRLRGRWKERTMLQMRKRRASSTTMPTETKRPKAEGQAGHG